jgi:hypothetical protein
VNRIEHPSIVQISEFGKTEDSHYMVMEFLRGEALSLRIDRLHSASKRLSVVESLQIGAQVADALTAAHEKGIIHRDLKPGNVMLVRDPVAPGGERAKVLDFGIAKLNEQYKAGRTGIHEVLGTPMYMSPEQCRGAGGVDEKTDVYALGVILYEMLAGEPPFVGVAGVMLMAKHVSQEPPPLRQRAPNLTPDVERLVHKLLIKDKDQRPPMKQVCDEIGLLLSKMSGVNPMPTSPGFAAGGAGDSERLFRTTLGHSLGQRLHLTQGPRWLVIACAVALLAMVAVLGRTAHSWLRHGRTVAGASGQPPVEPRPKEKPPTEKPATPVAATRDPSVVETPTGRPSRHKDPSKGKTVRPPRDPGHGKQPATPTGKPSTTSQKPRVQYED